MTSYADPDDAYAEFKHVVNMSAGEIEKWLGTEHSKEVGWSKSGEDESVGHHSGRHIVKILHKKKSELTDDDHAHMRKVISYCHRHLKQKPHGDVSETRWRYSLMNWGHDPLKKTQ